MIDDIAWKIQIKYFSAPEHNGEKVSDYVKPYFETEYYRSREAKYSSSYGATEFVQLLTFGTTSYKGSSEGPTLEAIEIALGDFVQWLIKTKAPISARVADKQTYNSKDF
ncbi:TPA: hypothetical protein QDB06_000820 [Burkholderia vietnamiensis]|nr:hypothetical protein [Burkholderia vietnamiensis]